MSVISYSSIHTKMENGVYSEWGFNVDELIMRRYKFGLKVAFYASLTLFNPSKATCRTKKTKWLMIFARRSPTFNSFLVLGFCSVFWQEC